MWISTDVADCCQRLNHRGFRWPALAMWVVCICVSFNGSGGESFTIASAIERLDAPSEDNSIMGDLGLVDEEGPNPAQIFLMASGKAGIIALDRYFFPPIDDLVTSLGAAGYKERNQASDRLEKLRPRCFPELKRHLKRTNEPEIRLRLNRLLEGDFDEDDYKTFQRRRQAAAVVVIRSNHIIAEGKRLIDNYIRQWAERHDPQDHTSDDIVNAIARCNNSELLTSILMKTFPSCSDQSWAWGGMARLLVYRLWYLVPAQMPKILDDWDVANRARPMPDMAERFGNLPSSLEELWQLADDLRKDYSKSQRRDAARKLIKEPDKRKVLLALHMYDWEMGPVQDVIKAIDAVPNEYLDHVSIDCMTLAEEFYPYRKRFLKKTALISEFFELCGCRPEENKEMLAMLLTHQDPEVANRAVVSFLGLFPDEIETVRKAQIPRILNSDISAADDIVVSFDGRHFDDWWETSMRLGRLPKEKVPRPVAKVDPRLEEWKKDVPLTDPLNEQDWNQAVDYEEPPHNPKRFRRAMLRRAPDLNISPALVRKHLTPELGCSKELWHYLLAHDQLAGIDPMAFATAPQYVSLGGGEDDWVSTEGEEDILFEFPWKDGSMTKTQKFLECFPGFYCTLLEKAIQRIPRGNALSFELDWNWFHFHAHPLRYDAAARKLMTDCLASENNQVRTFACCMLLSAGVEKEKALEALSKLRSIILPDTDFPDPMYSGDFRSLWWLYYHHRGVDTEFLNWFANELDFLLDMVNPSLNIGDFIRMNGERIQHYDPVGTMIPLPLIHSKDPNVERLFAAAFDRYSRSGEHTNGITSAYILLERDPADSKALGYLSNMATNSRINTFALKAFYVLLKQGLEPKLTPKRARELYYWAALEQEGLLLANLLLGSSSRNRGEFLRLHTRHVQDKKGGDNRDSDYDTFMGFAATHNASFGRAIAPATFELLISGTCHAEDSLMKVLNSCPVVPGMDVTRLETYLKAQPGIDRALTLAGFVSEFGTEASGLAGLYKSALPKSDERLKGELYMTLCQICSSRTERRGYASKMAMWLKKNGFRSFWPKSVFESLGEFKDIQREVLTHFSRKDDDLTGFSKRAALSFMLRVPELSKQEHSSLSQSLKDEITDWDWSREAPFLGDSVSINHWEYIQRDKRRGGTLWQELKRLPWVKQLQPNYYWLMNDRK